MTHWKERLDLIADSIVIGGLLLGSIRLLRAPENRKRLTDAVRERLKSRQFSRALDCYVALLDVEHLYSSAPARFGRMALWVGVGIAGMLFGLLARTSHASGHPAEIVSGFLMLVCLLTCGGAVADALTTGYRLYYYENYRRKTIEKIRKIVPDLV